MRPLIAIALSSVLLSGIYAYTSFTDRIRPQALAVQDTAAAGRFDLEITLTFDAVGDEFGNPSLLVRLGENELLRCTDAVSSGEPIYLDNIDGLVEGSNDLFVQVVPAAATGQTAVQDDAFALQAKMQTGGDSAARSSSGPNAVARAIRVRVLRDRQVVADQTLWSDPQWLVSGMIRVEIPRDANETDTH